MMRRWLLPLAVFAAVAVATHAVFHYLLPRYVMSRAMARIAEAAGGENRPLHTQPPTSRSRTIVKPSPDLVYTSCVYDLSAGPILVGGAPSRGYWSIGVYADNSDNVHVVGDRDGGGGAHHFVIAHPEQRGSIPAAHANLPIVMAPSRRGIVLFRYLVLDEADLAGAEAAQRTAVCRPL